VRPVYHDPRAECGSSPGEVRYEKAREAAGRNSMWRSRTGREKVPERVPGPDDYIGRIVAGKYRVEQLLGEGGMGKVYKATQLALDKPVVLKVLRQALLGDERTVARFQREAKAASRLNHPNSISVLDFGQAEDGAMYIAMEYVQGRDLHQILSREWPLPETRVVRIMSQVLSALADAHNAGVIHRDLKPENIMVEQRRGEADFVKVLDFGIAKIIDGTDEDGPALTRAGFVCGTPEYMSPEQARGAKLDHRSDLYGVGVMLYQLACGLLPFDSDSAVGFATKHLTEVPPPPSRRRADARISPSLERLIMRAMAKSPDDRPQSAEQFRAELLAIDKERRAGAGARRGGVSGVSRRSVTPTDLRETRVDADDPEPQWVEAGETRRYPTIPPALAGPVPAEMEASPSAGGEGNHLETTEGGGSLAFKVATVALMVLALTLAGTYGYQLLNQPREVFVPPTPVDEQLTARAGPAWEHIVPALMRGTNEAARLVSEGDGAWYRGSRDTALEKYLAAWRLDPQPEIALKLGELFFQGDKLAEARGFWGRFQRERPESKAIRYIDEVLPR
jgi:serine/threonine protein kinase